MKLKQRNLAMAADQGDDYEQYRKQTKRDTTLLKFRRLPEQHKLDEALFAKVVKVLQALGMKLVTGAIVDATIIGSASSPKNAYRQRGIEMQPDP